MRVGDLVTPVYDREYVYVCVGGESPDEVDVEETTWQGGVGVVLSFLEFDPPRYYSRVRVAIGDMIGWTYTDHIKVVS